MEEEAVRKVANCEKAGVKWHTAEARTRERKERKTGNERKHEERRTAQKKGGR